MLFDWAQLERRGDPKCGRSAVYHQSNVRGVWVRCSRGKRSVNVFKHSHPFDIRAPTRIPSDMLNRFDTHPPP